MKRTHAMILSAAVALAGLWWVAGSGAQNPKQNSGGTIASQKSAPADSKTVPAYYKSEQEAKPFPRLASPDVFRGYPVVVRAYEIANRMPGVIAQQPCYCWCEKSFGHKSLLHCYTSDHGAG